MVLQTCHGCMLSFKSPGFASYWFLGWSRGGHLWFDGHLCGSLRCLEHWVVDLHDPFICQFLRDRVEELGPQNESVRSFPRGKAELLYAVFVKSSWLLWRRKKKNNKNTSRFSCNVLHLKTSTNQGIHGLDFEHQCHHRCEDFSCATLFDGSALLDCCQWKHRHRGWKSAAFKGWHRTSNLDSIHDTWKCCIFSLVSIHSY